MRLPVRIDNACPCGIARAGRKVDRGEDIVVLIALGYAKEGARVARSEKRGTSDLARIHS